MKALSIRQPHASRIATGGKTIETRSWATPYRGPLLICSCKTMDANDKAALRPGESPGPLGQALAVANLVDCRPFAPSDREAAQCNCPEGYFSWVLEDIQPLAKPFPVKGQLGIFNVDLPKKGATTMTKKAAAKQQLPVTPEQAKAAGITPEQIALFAAAAKPGEPPFYGKNAMRAHFDPEAGTLELVKNTTETTTPEVEKLAKESQKTNEGKTEAA